LCFIFNKFGRCPVANIKTVVLNFYSEDEISAAKDLLFSELEKVKCDDLGRNLRRKPSDNRSRLEVDDTFDDCQS